MKRLPIILVIMCAFASLTWADSRPVKKVEVVNDPLNVYVVNHAGPVRYEYLVFAISGGAEAAGDFEENLNNYAVHLKSHVKSVKLLGKGVKRLNKSIKKLDKKL